MRNLFWLPVLVLTVALVAGPTFAKGGNGGGGGKPGGGGEDPPADAAPEIAYFEGSDILVMDEDGANQTLVMADAGQYDVTWSPDGGQLAFHGSSTLLGDGIWIVNKDGSGLTHPFDEPGFAAYPAWSAPTSAGVPEKIIFRHSSGLQLMDPDGNNQQTLTDGTLRNESYPAWSPDGTRFAARFNEWVKETYIDEDGVEKTKLVSTKAGLEIYTLTFDPQTGQATIASIDKVVEVLSNFAATPPVDANEVGFTWLDWSPDGRYLAYVDYDEATEHNDLLMIDVIDSNHPVTELTSTPDIAEFSPSWSPDGTQLVFERHARSRKETGLYLLDPFTGALQNLGARSGRFPEWMP